jgi:hypothetical protein
MPQEVIERVNQLGTADGQPELLTFYDRKGRVIGETEIPGVVNNQEDDGLGDLDPPTVNDDYGVMDQTEIDQYVPDIVEQVEDPIQEPELLPDPQAQVPDETHQQPPEQTSPGVPDQGAPILRRSERDRSKPKRLVPVFGRKTYESTAAVTTHLVHPDDHLDPDYVLVAHCIMVQCSLKTGMKHFKERGEKAVSKELAQLHFRDTFEPINPKDLNEQERKEVLESHLFLKEKRDETIKGRMVAGGNKQRGSVDKQDASSPTAALESVLLTAVILDAMEGRDVANVDIPNAFVQTCLENDEDKAIMRMRGKLAELMVKVAPEICTKYVIINKKGETALHVRLLNALCGIMKAALLCYQRFVTDIRAIGFEINPCDPCVANKIVKKKQLTIVWHVDDLKVSHVMTPVVTKLIDWLKNTYERLFDDGSGAMQVSGGKVLEHLGMTLDFTVPGEVKITMIPCVKEIIKLFAEHDKSLSHANTPAAEHLFKVNEDAICLDEREATVFHNFVAKCLFLTKRARPDISTAVAFLATRVKGSDEDDWKKLVRMIRYLRGSVDLPLILRADSVPIPKWWADGSHTAHPNMRGHSGGCMSLGKGMSINTSTKQKLNTRRSTETELVAADDFMPILLWTNYFLEAQGCGHQDTILCQDNQSAILLENNGRKSSSKRTKHLDCRFYFITDRISNNELSVECCPTEEMIGDFFTKRTWRAPIATTATARKKTFTLDAENSGHLRLWQKRLEPSETKHCRLRQIERTSRLATME